MSQLLNSLLAEIGDPDREDLLQVAVPRVHGQIRGLSRPEQLELRREVTEALRPLTLGEKAYWSHRIIFQYLWHLTGVMAKLTPEQQTLKDEIWRSFREQNGDWYKSQTFLTPEEAWERISSRSEELAQEGPADAR